MGNSKKLFYWYLPGYFGLLLLSYIFNVGWMRVIFLLVFLLYLLRLIFVYFGYVKQLLRADVSQKDFHILFYASLPFLLFNLFLEDGGDVAPTYCFFGLIKLHSNLLVNVTQIIAWISLLVHLFYNHKLVRELRKFKEAKRNKELICK